MILLLALLSCGSSETRRYDSSLLHLGTGYNAKMACSCMFVMGGTEEECEEWLRVSPDVARFRVDTEAKTVRSTALGGWATTARWVDEQVGCTVD